MAQMKKAIRSFRLRLHSGLRQRGGAHSRAAICRAAKAALGLAEARPFRFLPHGRFGLRAEGGVDGRLPGLLLGVMDGGHLERRVLRLIEERLPMSRGGRLVAAAGCVVVIGVLSAGVVMAGVRPIHFAEEAQLLHSTGPLPAYEAATIKLAKDDGRQQAGQRSPSEFVIHDFTVKDLLQMAYGIKSDNQLEGVSGWMTSEHFDVEIKLGDEEIAAEQKLPIMQRVDRWALLMQRLLAERFDLKTSEAMKDVQVYELVVAKGGAKVKASEMVDDPERPGTKKPAQGPFERLRGPGKMDATGVPMSLLGEALGRLPDLGGGQNFGGGRMVLDKTGLAGLYDWSLVWTPSNVEAGAASPNPEAPGLFTAIEEQLGLKLVSAKAPVQVLVVDHIEQPSEN